MPHHFTTLVAATRNPAKIARYQALLAQYASHVAGLDELGVRGIAMESGETAEDNARLKALYYARQSGHPVFSDDAALYVDFLPPDQQPGVHVRRINGVDEASDDALLAHWEHQLARSPALRRSGRWHVGFCLAWPDGAAQLFTLDLPLTFYSPSSPRRTPGWPLNSLSGPAEFDRPYCELSASELDLANRHVDQAVARIFAEMT